MAAIREWYGGYSIIYRWFEDNFGYEGLVDYWHYIAKEVYSELAEEFRRGGLPYIRNYFQEIIEADEGRVQFEQTEGALAVDILESPDYIWQMHYDQGYSMPRDHYYKSYETIYGDVAAMAGMGFEMLRYDKDGKLKFQFTKRRA
ncbi:MAG: hypothetical protein RRZ24_06160 [Clostridia bacterium]